MEVGTAEYDQLLKSVMDHLHEHNDSEEINDLPQLFEKIGADGAQAAALEFKRTKKFAPTQYVFHSFARVLVLTVSLRSPHPAAPNKPPFETIVGLLSAPLDKLRDAFHQFPTHEDKEAAEQHAQQKN